MRLQRLEGQRLHFIDRHSGVDLHHLERGVQPDEVLPAQRLAQFLTAENGQG